MCDSPSVGVEVQRQGLVSVGEGPLGPLVVAVQSLRVVGQPLIVTDVLVQRLRKLPWKPNRERRPRVVVEQLNTTGCTDMHSIRVQRDDGDT